MNQQLHTVKHVLVACKSGMYIRHAQVVFHAKIGERIVYSGSIGCHGGLVGFYGILHIALRIFKTLVARLSIEQSQISLVRSSKSVQLGKSRIGAGHIGIIVGIYKVMSKCVATASAAAGLSLPVQAHSDRINKAKAE